MFIRIKTRKNSQGTEVSYAYLVSSRYRKKGAKQKVLKYLGKVHSFEKEKTKSFHEFLNEDPSSFISRKSLKTSLKSLIRLELENHGFRKITEKRYSNANVIVNFVTKEVKDIASNNPVCVALNDGFLTDYTISKVLNFKAPEALNKEIGKTLAKRLINAGVLLDQSTFVSLFQKLQQDLSIS